MTPGLVRFYSDIAFTGSSHQFYSKYKYRFYANKIFTTLWQHEVYRKALRDISRTEQFERFINMIMTDSTYCFDEITEKYDKLKEYDMKRANNSMTPEDLRSEELISGAMTGNLLADRQQPQLLKSLELGPETFDTEANLACRCSITSRWWTRPAWPTGRLRLEFMLADLLITRTSIPRTSSSTKSSATSATTRRRTSPTPSKRLSTRTALMKTYWNGSRR
jgi:hypothetical protein